MDGVGEWATASIGVGRGNDIELLTELRWPDSLGLLYSAFTYYTGFKVNSGEYKVMGLAPYGEPKYVGPHLRAADRPARGRLVHAEPEVLRLPRRADHDQRARSTSCSADRRACRRRTLTQREMDLARSVQEVSEEIMLRMARTAHRETGLENLCLAGGVALNCVGNGRLLREGPFKQALDPARGRRRGRRARRRAAHLASALPASRARARPGRDDACRAPTSARHSRDDEIERFLETDGRRLRAARSRRRAARSRRRELLADEKVVGWFNGRMEFGPRALGARSILGDPAQPADAGADEPEDQVPRGLPAVRAQRAAGAGARLLRAGLRLALHAAGRAGARTSAGSR